MTRPSSRWLAFIAATILVAVILVAVPPPTSTLLFVIVVAGMAALAGINAARQAGLSVRDVLALLADRSRAGWWAWDAARRAVQTPPLAHTLERPIAPIQLAPPRSAATLSPDQTSNLQRVKPNRLPRTSISRRISFFRTSWTLHL